jgi:Tfp pilus assembly protein PilF
MCLSLVGMKRLALLAGLAAAACATEPPPAAALASARAAVEHAGAGVAQHAPSELAAAQIKLGRAQDALARGDNLRARRLAEEAEVDARLAWAMSENERLRPAQ